jgi:hypothetical protein
MRRERADGQATKSITPTSRDRPFADLRDQVADGDRQEERRHRLCSRSGRNASETASSLEWTSSFSRMV